MTQTLSKRVQELISYRSNYVDYDKFGGNPDDRTRQIGQFVNNLVHNPIFDYPDLEAEFNDGEKYQAHIEKKHRTLQAIYELEALKDNGELTQDEYDLYIDLHEMNLKRMLLVEEAYRLQHTGSSSDSDNSRAAYLHLNHELFGEMDHAAFQGIMATEAARVERFRPANARSHEVQSVLLDYVRQHHFEGEEPELLTENDLQEVNNECYQRHGEALRSFPETDAMVRYDADRAVAMLNIALEIDGFTALGWMAEVVETRRVPATNSVKKRVYIPRTFLRTSSEIRRLYRHEVLVHALSGRNGAVTGVQPLAEGTADYADIEEGDGIVQECAEAGTMDNPSFHRARDRYILAGLALGIDGTQKDGRSSYEIMWRLIALRLAGESGDITDDIEQQAKAQAMIHEENAFRGTNFSMPGVIYMKLKVYYEGLLGASAYYRRFRSNMKHAYDRKEIGKYNHTSDTEYARVQRAVEASRNRQGNSLQKQSEVV